MSYEEEDTYSVRFSSYLRSYVLHTCACVYTYTHTHTHTHTHARTHARTHTYTHVHTHTHTHVHTRTHTHTHTQLFFGIETVCVVAVTFDHMRRRIHVICGGGYIQ